MEETMNKIYEYLATYGLQLIAAILIFVIGKWIARLLSNAIEKLMTRSNVEPTLVTFIKNLAYIGLLSFVIIAALGKLGIQTASFIAVLGAAGLAVGLALQGSLANFAAGVMILVFRPFKVGQFIIAAGEMGTIKEIGIFTTTLATPDNVRLIMPNAQLIAGSIKNYSANETRRVDLVIGVSYKDDIKKAKQIIMDVIQSAPKVLKDPGPVVAVHELAESSVNFVVRPWVNSSDYWEVYFYLTENIKLALDRSGITIPFPQRDVHVYSEVSESGRSLEGTSVKS
jgi:small conductance mechanosensitive channel